MSKSFPARSLRGLLLLGLLAAVALAVRNALADKGGTYDPADGA